MSRIPLQTLPTFRAVARRQNLRQAAEELHLTHSAVSQQIRLLEDQAGFPLFERRGRGLVLNPAGQALLPAVELALDEVARGLRQAQAATDGAAQTLRLTVLPSFAQRWLLPRVASWREAHPEFMLEVHASQQVVDLRREGFHAALRAGSGNWPGLVAERLDDSPLIALATPARAARLKTENLMALASEPLLGADEEWRRFLAQCGCALRGRTVADFNDAGLLLQAAEADIGIALARELLARDAVLAGRLVRVAPTLSLPASAGNAVSPIWLVYEAHLAGWPPLRALRQWLLAEMAPSGSADVLA